MVLKMMMAIIPMITIILRIAIIINANSTN